MLIQSDFTDLESKKALYFLDILYINGHCAMAAPALIPLLAPLGALGLYYVWVSVYVSEGGGS